MTGPVALEAADRVSRLGTTVPRRTPSGDACGVRGGAAAGRSTPSGHRREIAAAGAGSLVVAAAMNWPALREPTRTVPQDLVDPLYFVWQVAWTGHAVGSDPISLYTTNAFLGAARNLAYTDTVLGYAPFAAVVNALVPGTAGALLTYNLLFVLAAALAFAGAYGLARVLGARVPGALVAAAGYAYAPWHLAHARHLNVVSTGGIALALALICYGHGWSLRPADDQGREVWAGRPARPGWALAGWAVACWQLTLGFALGVPFAWTLGLVVAVAVVSWWRRGRPPVPARLRRADLTGGAAFALTGVLLAVPYLRVVHEFPVARRTDEMVSRYSPPLHGLVTAPPESWWWGSLQTGLRTSMASVPEQAVLPGLVLTVLAVAGLRWSVWSRRNRLLLAAGALLTGLLAVGTSAPAGGRFTYLLIFHHLPGFEAVRTPGRLVLWSTLALALLAAGAVTRAAESDAARRWARAGSRLEGGGSGRVRRRVVAGLLVVPAMLVLAEGVGRVAQPLVPRPPVTLRSLPAPVLVLPTSQQGDYRVMTWSTDGWPALVNGGSGFEPPAQSQLRRTARAFPAYASVAQLRGEGVRTVLLDRSAAAGTPWAALAAQPEGPAAARAAAAGVRVRYTGDAVVYDLRRPGDTRP